MTEQNEFQEQQPAAEPQQQAYQEPIAPPPPYYPPVYTPQEPQPPVKQRRVGTFTLGLALILIGVMIPLTMIYKDKALFIVQFAPLILVVLGIEILIYAIFFKNGKLKYDGFSIFLTIMITIVSVGISSIAPIATRAIEFDRLSNELVYDAEQEVETALNTVGATGDVDVYSFGYDYYGYFHDVERAPRIQLSCRVALYISESQNGLTEDEAAALITKLVKEVDLSEHPIEQFYFSLYRDHNNANNTRVMTVSLRGNQVMTINEQMVKEHMSIDELENQEEEMPSSEEESSDFVSSEIVS